MYNQQYQVLTERKMLQKKTQKKQTTKYTCTYKTYNRDTHVRHSKSPNLHYYWGD